MPHRRVFLNGRTTTGPSSIDSLQTFAHPPPLPPFALLRCVRRAAVPEKQSVEEREKGRPGCRNQLHLQRENNLFSVLRKYCNQEQLSSEAIEEASLTCPTAAFF